MLREAIKSELAKRELARRHLLDFVCATKPDYQAGWFAREVCAALDWFTAEVAAKRSPRLMLFAPPRHGKSEIVSRRFPAFALGRDPDCSIIATSYADTLAASFNRDVQRIIDGPRYTAISPDTTLSGQNVRTVSTGKYLRNSDTFEIVDHRGAYNSAGVGGGITGKGADILIVDDPIKDAAQASSRTYRDSVWAWYTSTAYTRLAPGGGVLIILTRWHEDDLAGRLLEAQKDGAGDTWRVLSFPAIAETDEEHRKEGEALDPGRYSLGQLKAIKITVGARVWAALYQQRPAPQEGGLFRREWWRYWRRPGEPEVDGKLSVVLPDTFDEQLLSWDLAFKATDKSDRVAGGVWGVKGANRFLLDLDWRRMTFCETVGALRRQAQAWPKAYTKLVEDKANGPAVIDVLHAEIAGLIAINPEGGKESRAAATSPQVEAGNVYLPLHAPWRDAYIEEHAGFPNSVHDDAVDQQSQVLLRLATHAPVVCATTFGGTTAAPPWEM